MSLQALPEFLRELVKFPINEKHTCGITYCLVRFYQVTEFFRQGIREMVRTDCGLCDPEIRNKGHAVKRYVLFKMKIRPYLVLEVADNKTVRFNPGILECFHFTTTGKKNEGVDIHLVERLHELPKILMNLGNCMARILASLRIEMELFYQNFLYVRGMPG